VHPNQINLGVFDERPSIDGPVRITVKRDRLRLPFAPNLDLDIATFENLSDSRFRFAANVFASENFSMYCMRRR
jgi:hypothetical protein